MVEYIQVERTCRYGHGPLMQETKVWTLPSQIPRHMLPEILDSPPWPSHYFSVTVWRCPVCGYVELIDSP